MRLVGFAASRAGGGWDLAGFTVRCRAADAVAVKVRVRGPPSPAADQWVNLVGAWEPGAGDGALPVVRARSVTLIDAPRDPYV